MFSQKTYSGFNRRRFIKTAYIRMKLYSMLSIPVLRNVRFLLKYYKHLQLSQYLLPLLNFLSEAIGHSGLYFLVKFGNHSCLECCDGIIDTYL